MHPHADGGALVTRTQAARLLGRSLARVRQYENKKRLHPMVDRDGVHHFARSEVLALAKQIGARASAVVVSGELSAEAFKLFFQGAPIAEVVIKTQLRPEQVRELYAEYQTPLGSRVPVATSLEDYDERARTLDDELSRKRRAKRR